MQDRRLIVRIPAHHVDAWRDIYRHIELRVANEMGMNPDDVPATMVFGEMIATLNREFLPGHGVTERKKRSAASRSYIIEDEELLDVINRLLEGTDIVQRSAQDLAPRLKVSGRPSSKESFDQPLDDEEEMDRVMVEAIKTTVPPEGSGESG